MLAVFHRHGTKGTEKPIVILYIIPEKVSG